MFEKWRRSRALREKAERLYATLNKASRAPGFYVRHGVPDTLDGRFDMMILHGHLVLRRLHRAGADGVVLAQALFDTMFAQLDIGLREHGVSDVGIGRKVKQMAEAYYGRARAYDAALNAPEGGAALTEALSRNLYRGAVRDPASLKPIADYVRRVDAFLATLPDGLLLEGCLSLPPFEEAEP